MSDVRSERGAWQWRGIEQLSNENVGRDLFRLRLKVEEHTMTQHGTREGAHVFKAGARAPLQQRTRLRTQAA